MARGRPRHKRGVGWVRLRGCACISSTGPTNCSGSTSAARHATGGASEPGPYAATIGVLGSTLALVEDGATHIGVASDHIIESFRNDLWPGYKTSEGMPTRSCSHQIPVVEDASVAMGVVTWAMVEYEADDALGAAAAIADADARVEQVLIVTPDKDLGQCVGGTRVVQFDRRKREIIDEAGVIEKFGVGPASIPDYLGLVGDTADGFPGLPGWGAKSAALRARPVRPHRGHPAVGRPMGRAGPPRRREAGRHAAEPASSWRCCSGRIATVELDVDVGTVDDWRWTGPTHGSPPSPNEIGAPELRRARADRRRPLRAASTSAAPAG